MKEEVVSLPTGTLIPNHLAIIPDGNRRWARARGLPAFEGHHRGFDITPAIARACRQLGVHTVTIWAFSTENWKRSPAEVGFLMKKYEDFIGKHLKEARRDKARIVHLGRKDRIPASLAKKLEQAEKETEKNEKYLFNVALDYNGRDEILRATKKMLAEGLDPEKLDEEVYSQYLDTHGQPYPYPDLLIRSSGEQRTSGLFSWQSAYTELYWLKDHFPDFNVEKLKEAILDYSRRRRRFGSNDDVPRVSFDPQKVGELEAAWWKAHGEGATNGQLSGLLARWVKELYGLGENESKKAVEFLVEGVVSHNKRNWERAVERVAGFYELLKQKVNFVFNPQVVAQLEINYWQIHDRLESLQDKWQLEKAFQDLYGEIYRLSELQAFKIAHLKALATSTHDLAEKCLSEEERSKFWDQTEDYLVKSYTALKEVAS